MLRLWPLQSTSPFLEAIAKTVSLWRSDWQVRDTPFPLPICHVYFGLSLKNWLWYLGWILRQRTHLKKKSCEKEWPDWIITSLLIPDLKKRTKQNKTQNNRPRLLRCEHVKAGNYKTLQSKQWNNWFLYKQVQIILLALCSALGLVFPLYRT